MLERYVIIERIAIGGMGEVFVARQEGVGGFRRTVVLKKLLPSAEGSDEAARRMLDEARINGALSHENVVTVLEVGEEAGLPWLALEYVHGENAGSLRHRASKRELPLPVVVAARIVCDAARGLAAAHDAKDVDGRPLNIIHRDIAPKNLFVRTDGLTKVGDFGIARADDRLSHTATGAVAGTLSYMSPEQLSHGAMTPQSDQFSLGIVLWELLAGRRLFQRPGPVETAERILSGGVKPPSRHRDGIPTELDRIALRMLELEARRRFPDCSEVAAAIEAAVPDASPTVGRAAVAAFVEELAGDDLRDRQRRIEEGAEQTTRGARPTVFSQPSSSSNAPTSASGTDDPTVREGNAPSRPPPSSPASAQAPSTPTRSISPPTQLTSEASLTVAPPAPGPTRRSRAALAVVAVVVVLLAGVAIVALRPRAPDVEALTRAHLEEAARLRPLTFREAVVDDAVAWDLDEPVAERLAETLQALMRQRFTLWRGHHAHDAATRERERVAVIAQDQAILQQVRETLAPHGDTEFRDRVFRIWQLDSAVPYRFLPALTHDELQRRIYPNGVAYMKQTREQRWSQAERLAKRARVDWARVRAAIEPIVVEREAMLARYGTAPASELPGLEESMKALKQRGRQALSGVVPDDVADALVAAAFIGVPDTKRGEAQIDEKALVVFGG